MEPQIAVSPKQNSKSKLTIMIVLILIFILINLTLAYYFFIYLKQNKFPKITSTVNSQELDTNGFKKVDVLDDKVSYFVPKYWIEIDKENKVYGDSLNGAHAYMNQVPNNLGLLKDDVCNQLSSRAEERLKDKNLYSDLKVVSSKIEKYGDHEGCIVSLTGVINKKIYQIEQFYIFRKESIFILTSQYPLNLELQKNKIESTLRSIIITE